MTCNLGAVERSIRLVLGVVLIAVAYFAAFPAWAALTLYLVGAIAIGTAAIGFCPAWKLAGINTCGTQLTAKR
jgi:hypothetical protein